MATKSIKESIITTHKKSIDAILDIDVENNQIKAEVLDDDVYNLADLIKAFDGECVTISVTSKIEGEIPEE